MTAALASHLPAFAVNDWIFASALRAIPEGDADRRLDARTNGARGIAQHLLAARHGLCALLGAPAQPLPWGDLGQGPQAGFATAGPQPRLAAILAAWQGLQPHFAKALRTVAPDVLAQPSPLPIPDRPNACIADFAGLNVVHEGYHLGQLGLLAKAFTGKGILTFVPGEAR